MEGRLVSETLIKAEAEVRSTVEKALQEMRDTGPCCSNSCHHRPAALRASLQEALLKILESLHTPRSKADAAVDETRAGPTGSDTGLGEREGAAGQEREQGARAGESAAEPAASRPRQGASRPESTETGVGVAFGPRAAGATRTNFMTFAQYKKMAGPHATTAQWKQYTGQTVAGTPSVSASSCDVGGTQAPAAAPLRSPSSDRGVKGVGSGDGTPPAQPLQPLSAVEDNFYTALMALDEQVARLRCVCAFVQSSTSSLSVPSEWT